MAKILNEYEFKDRADAHKAMKVFYRVYLKGYAYITNQGRNSAWKLQIVDYYG